MNRVRIDDARTQGEVQDWMTVLVQAMVVDLAVARHGKTLEGEVRRMLGRLTAEECRMMIQTKAKFPKMSLLEIYDGVVTRGVPKTPLRRLAGWLFGDRGRKD